MTVAILDAFAASRTRFEGLVGSLRSDETSVFTHSELENHLQTHGHDLVRQLIQDHLDLRAVREARLDDLHDSDGIPRGTVEPDHARILTTVFGDVEVHRLAYRRRGYPNLHPADGILNLPVEQYSHGLRQMAAVESARGSFDDAVAAIRRASGAGVEKRQVEDLTRKAATDFDTFYAQRTPTACAATDVLVLSCDGKGIVMRTNGLRSETGKAAAQSDPKLSVRLSPGEKRNRKRMAEVGAVYDITPAPRSPTDILSRGDRQQKAEPPVVSNKWLTASVLEDAATVVGQLFDEAQRRDPDCVRTWIALVDGNNHQIDCIKAQARARNVPVTILIDFIHVLEYIWGAAWSFFKEGDPAAEKWVFENAIRTLEGKATRVAGAIRRTATNRGLTAVQRKNADICARYLTRKARHLDYPTALESGWPIATGVIEGACRHLVKDRLDITGARWSVGGAEAVLKLRALRSNGDFDEYWPFHLAQEHVRQHSSRYANAPLPRAA